jgi:hypothetical protein
VAALEVIDNRRDPCAQRDIPEHHQQHPPDKLGYDIGQADINLGLNGSKTLVNPAIQSIFTLACWFHGPTEPRCVPNSWAKPTRKRTYFAAEVMYAEPGTAASL